MEGVYAEFGRRCRCRCRCLDLVSTRISVEFCDGEMWYELFYAGGSFLVVFHQDQVLFVS